MQSEQLRCYQVEILVDLLLILILEAHWRQFLFALVVEVLVLPSIHVWIDESVHESADEPLVLVICHSTTLVDHCS